MRRRSQELTRAEVVRRIELRLRLQSFPRLQMMLLVGLTGGFGLLASFGMLQFGLESMAVRYPLALAAAYGFFLLLLWLWLRTRAEDYTDIPDPSGLVPSPSTGSASPTFESGGGGDFSGGGASGSYDAQSLAASDASPEPSSLVKEAAGGLDGADELAVPLLVIVLAVGLALASLYVVYIAPVLFAELLVDGALTYALVRHLRKDDRPLWFETALRRTVWPFAITAVFLVIVGAAMSAYAPTAKSIGQVIEHAASKHSR